MQKKVKIRVIKDNDRGIKFLPVGTELIEELTTALALKQKGLVEILEDVREKKETERVTKLNPQPEKTKEKEIEELNLIIESKNKVIAEMEEKIKQLEKLPIKEEKEPSETKELKEVETKEVVTRLKKGRPKIK